MKTLFLKAFGSAIFFLIYDGRALAAPALNLSDTIQKLLQPANKNERLIVIREANVIYPLILQCNEAESIDYIEKFSVARKNYLVNTFNRSRQFFPKVIDILKKYNVPQEFKVLLALESGFNGNVVSPAGAVGYWQIMDEVAKEYGLNIPSKIKAQRKKFMKGRNKMSMAMCRGIDERKNLNKSTLVAARYLNDRSRNLNNDWLLIAASYNCGVGNVWNAMERSGKKSPTFWDIKNYLPAETRAYVMNFITLNVIFYNYEAFANNTLCFRDITCIEESGCQDEDDLEIVKDDSSHPPIPD